ncbi:Methyl-accepting chemotaxis protein I (serine chemoreceptor protein) [Castellaniella defragrans 65Phen]|uniref:Methyl-accepting chemotaxis protein I (Serine chemoreceptor protein) n=4 Tax=Castellaniella defragrans TaxID=75697 RepID=W8X5S7_CASD6|nr:Methyl-accepting chemotaxis protein I (serine chemoreceptor protein) [Castellaniella defragrans 65Phen]
MKIGTRLALGFGLIIILLLIMSAIGAWRMIDSQRANDNLEERQTANALILQWARQVEVNANQALAAANLTNPDVLAVFKKGMDTSDQNATDIRAKIETMISTPEAKTLYDNAMRVREAYIQGRTQAFKDLDNGDYAKADTFFNQEMPKITAQYIAEIDKLSQFQSNVVARLFGESEQDTRLGLTVLAVATLLALILGPLFAWRVTRSVTHPLRHAVKLAEAVAHRDLSADVVARGSDEIGQLLSALATMTRNLRSAMTEVRTGSDAIASASSQISAGNLDLSSRTEQQASSLAETAATMEEITATVRQNADNAQQANTLAASAAKTATDGGAIVAELVSTMSEINTKSQQVADIIGVIDSIAFQTNILALNAAVEAARAGEQGRGFAVVASEVRALAQRSAGAAKEIKGLIDTSVESTAKGNEQASRAGATMQDIVDSINRVTDIMGEISAASREQTTGIEEINAAVTQMDDVTRQNASLVEESAAAASSLQEQADTLARLVATFTLSQSDAAGAQGGAHARARTGAQAGAQAGARAAQAEAAAAGAGAARAAQPARIPSAPEKVVSPAPHRPRHDAPADAPAPRAAAKPALRAPGKPAPASADTEEWTEF